MRGIQADAVASERLRELLRDTGEDPQAVAAQLFAAVDTIESAPQLRGALANPSAPSAAKTQLVAQLWDGHLGRAALELLRLLVGQRWATDESLAVAIERLGVAAVLAGARDRGTLGTLAAQLYDLASAVTAQPQARDLLSDEDIAVEKRQAFVATILGPDADPATVLLTQRACRRLHGGHQFLPGLAAIAAEVERSRVVLTAQVTTAVVLSDAQKQRLEAILTREYGHPVEVYVTVDTAVLGGLRVQVGSHVIDNTVLSRLADARRLLAGQGDLP